MSMASSPCEAADGWQVSIARSHGGRKPSAGGVEAAAAVDSGLVSPPATHPGVDAGGLEEVAAAGLEPANRSSRAVGSHR